MKLESQVVSLSLAKKLKELGVEQKSYFVWWDAGFEKPHMTILPANEMLEGYLSAFTVAELGEMLPGYECGMTASTPDNPPEGYLDGIELVHVRENGWWVTRVGESYYDANNDTYPEFKAKTEADARAEMLIYLLENNLLPTPSMKVD